MTNRVRVSIGSDTDELPLIAGAVRTFCGIRGLTGDQGETVSDLTLRLASWLIGRAYPDDPTGEIVVQLELGEGEVRVTIEDWGEPISSFGGGGGPAPDELADIDAKTADLRLVNLGRDGKRLSFSVSADGAKPTNLARFGPIKRQADPDAIAAEQVVVRDSTPEDAEAISRLLFTNYGLGYGHPEFYEPGWVIEQMESGAVTSSVAEVSGEVVGHHGLMRGWGEASAESGIAVVHPGYRGLGVFGKLFAHTLERSRGMGLQAIYGRAVTTHPYSQRSEAANGYRTAALLLGSVPTDGRSDVTGRGATIAAFLPLEHPPREVAIPSRYAEQLTAIYEHVGLELTDQEPEAASAKEHPAVEVRSDDSRRTSTITLRHLNPTTRPELIEALRHVVHRHDELAWCDLDLHTLRPDELDAAVALLREYDFFLAGLMPFGVGGHDRLRLQSVLTDDVQLDGLVIDSDFALTLRDWVYADHNLVVSD